MEKIKSLILALCISTSALLANDNQWKSVHSELKQVFIPNKTVNKIEIINIQLMILLIYKVKMILVLNYMNNNYVLL